MDTETQQPEDVREPIFWSASPDVERLYHESIESCIDDYVDNFSLEDCPSEVTLYGWARAPVPKIPSYFADSLVESILERLDEECGDPEEAMKATPAMIEKARELIEFVRAKYNVWTCEIVCTEIHSIPVCQREENQT